MMPRKKGQVTEENPKRNWCFKVHHIIDGQDLIAAEMHRAHQYANKLIELEQTRRHESDRVIDNHYPGFLALKEEYQAAAEAKKLAETPEDRKAVKERFVVAKAAYKPDADRVYSDPLIRTALEQTELEHAEAIKQARANCGCYWGTYLLVENSLRHIRQGAPPRYRRWHLDGSVGCQLQQGLAWTDVMAGNDSRLRVRVQALGERPRFNKRGVPLPQANPECRESRVNKQPRP
jgi:hypothetical protein